MILAIDIGNTTVEFGFVKNQKFIKSYKLSSNLDRTADDWLLDLQQIFFIEQTKVDDFIISSVVPQIEDKISFAIKKGFSKTPLIIGKNIDIPIKNNYKNPQEVGIDRLVNAFGAISKVNPPVIVIDLGTAITFDVVNEKGEYEGGAIFPGIDSSIKTLFSKTSKLPMVSLSESKNPVGKTTIESIQSGIFFGYCSLIEGMVDRIKKQYSYDFNIILTGGNAKLISKGLKIRHILDEYLSLEGIYLIYNFNRSKL